jgi:glyoxylase I family protein
MILSIFHININVTNFERSLAFYQSLGFRMVRDLGEGGSRAMAEGLGMPGAKGRAALLMLGDDEFATRLDLIEWKQPATEGAPYPRLNHAGIARVALRTRDLVAEYERLAGEGVEFLSTPVETRLGSGERFVCMKDPDGTIIELIEFPPRSRPAP